MITQKELEEIKAGRPFFTIDGRKCQLLKDDLPNDQPLAVYVNGANEVSTYSEDGRYLRTGQESGWDLVVERDVHDVRLRFTVMASFRADQHEIDQLGRNVKSAIHCTEAMMTFGTGAELISLEVEES